MHMKNKGLFRIDFIYPVEKRVGKKYSAKTISYDTHSNFKVIIGESM